MTVILTFINKNDEEEEEQDDEEENEKEEEGEHVGGAGGIKISLFVNNYIANVYVPCSTIYQSVVGVPWGYSSSSSD